MKSSGKRLLQQLFHPNSAQSRAAPAAMPASQSEMMDKLLMMLDQTQPAELGCDEVFALVDQFAEMAAHGENVAQLMPSSNSTWRCAPTAARNTQVLQKLSFGEHGFRAGITASRLYCLCECGSQIVRL